MDELSTNLAEVGADCISRQAAIDGKICIRRSNGVEIYDDYAVPVEYLEQLPSAQPKKGKWIHDGSKWTNRWICSECGYKWFFDCIEGAYCPNCGADMRGEQDG